MKPHAPLSLGLTLISAVLLAVLVNGYSIVGFSIFWVIGLIVAGSTISIFHHRAAHRSFALDAVFLASAIGLGVLAAVLVFALTGTLLNEGSMQPHVLVALITFLAAFAGLLVVQFSYALGLHATRPMVMRSLFGAGGIALIAVLAVQVVATIEINRQVEQVFGSDPWDPRGGVDHWEASYVMIEDTALAKSAFSFRSQSHDAFETTREPLRSCKGILVNTVSCADLVSDAAVGIFDSVILEMLLIQFVEDAGNATPVQGAVLDESDRALLNEAASEILPLFADTQSNADRALAREKRGELDDVNRPDAYLVMIGERSTLSRAARDTLFASAYGSSLRDHVVGVLERMFVFGTHAPIAAPALLAEHDPSLLDDPLFIAVTLERIERYREENT